MGGKMVCQLVDMTGVRLVALMVDWLVVMKVG